MRSSSPSLSHNSFLVEPALSFKHSPVSFIFKYKNFKAFFAFQLFLPLLSSTPRLLTNTVIFMVSIVSVRVRSTAHFYVASFSISFHRIALKQLCVDCWISLKQLINSSSLKHSLRFNWHHNPLICLKPPGVLSFFSDLFFTYYLDFSFEIQPWVLCDFLFSSALVCSALSSTSFLCSVSADNYHLYADDC